MKKIIILSLTFFFALYSYAQTNLDVILYYKICEYRKDNGLDCWVWSDNVWKVAKSHSAYQTQTGTMGHYGGSSTKRLAGERFTYYGIKWIYVGENCAVTNSDGKDDIAIANKILFLWKNSPEHNALLLSDRAEFAGVSCLKGRNYKWSHNDHWWTYATLNVYIPN